MWDTAPSYLEAAEAAARWIRSAAQETEHGLVWLPEPDHPERRATVTAPPTLYSGSAGIVLFLLELARATGDAAYLDDARRGADQLAASWREALDVAPLVPLENAHLDFGMGLAGTAFTLAHAWRATQDDRYRQAALAITAHIVGAARPAGGGVTWTGSPTVGLGDGSGRFTGAGPLPSSRKATGMTTRPIATVMTKVTAPHSRRISCPRSTSGDSS